ATDEAGHAKDPVEKRSVIEEIDTGLGGLTALCGRAVVCVTGDHATPSSGRLPHSGEPTPLLVAGPTIRPDGVEEFGETQALAGQAGSRGRPAGPVRLRRPGSPARPPSGAARYVGDSHRPAGAGVGPGAEAALTRHRAPKPSPRLAYRCQLMRPAWRTRMIR